MKTATCLTNARAIVAKMPTNQAKRLRRILTLPVRPSQHRDLILRSGLPLGALMIAETFAELRRVA